MGIISNSNALSTEMLHLSGCLVESLMDFGQTHGIVIIESEGIVVIFPCSQRNPDVALRIGLYFSCTGDLRTIVRSIQCNRLGITSLKNIICISILFGIQSTCKKAKFIQLVGIQSFETKHAASNFFIVESSFCIAI